MNTDLEIIMYLYAVLGIYYILIEPKMYLYEDFKEIDKTEVLIATIQTFIHYIRIGLVWPLYVIEDILIDISNSRNANE